MAQEPQPSQIALELVHAPAPDRGNIMETTPSFNEPSAQTIEAKHEPDMITPAPLIIGPGSHSIENEHKSMAVTHVLPDGLSTPDFSHKRHESKREPATPSGQQKPESIIQDTPQVNGQPPTASETAQRQETRKSRSSLNIDYRRLLTETWISRPGMSIIDLDDCGLRTISWRGWADGPKTERPGLSTANSSIRIILVERNSIEKQNWKNTKKRFKDRVKTAVDIDLIDPEAHKKETDEEEQNRGKFRMRDLQALLNTEETGPSFLLQTNSKFSGHSSTWQFIMHDLRYFNPLLSEHRRIGFNYWFLEVYTKFAFNFSDDLGVEAYCEFPTVSLTHPSINQEQSMLDKLSPTQKAFEEILLSTRSSLELATGNARLTRQLIVLDLMRSTLEGWETFLREFMVSSSKTKRNPPKSVRSMNLKELEDNVETSTSINSIIRDFAACLAFLIASIEASLPLQKEDARAAKWKFLATEIEYLSQAVQDMAQDLADTSDRRLASFVAQFGQDQANSAKRLTIVASIFLPLTLSASLMAMTTRVRAIGDLWYDWAGLCFVTGTIVFVVYSNWKILERFLFKHLKSSQGLIASEVVQAFPLTWWASTFLAVITSSFVAGMFYTKRTAAEILKYGIPAFVGFAVLWLALKVLFDMVRIQYRMRLEVKRAVHVID